MKARRAVGSPLPLPWVQVEVQFSFPPPVQFKRQFSPAWLSLLDRTYDTFPATFGCSLSAIAATAERHGSRCLGYLGFMCSVHTFLTRSMREGCAC